MKDLKISEGQLSKLLRENQIDAIDALIYYRKKQRKWNRLYSLVNYLAAFFCFSIVAIFFIWIIAQYLK